MATNKYNLKDIEAFLTKKYDFIYNEIKNTLDYKIKGEDQYNELRDFELNSVVRDLKKADFPSIQKKDIIELLNSNYVKKTNPIAEYFEGLEEWSSGEADYIEQLSGTVDVPDSEKKSFTKWFKKWIVGVVACAIDPGKVNQQALIFVGNQGIGKTTWILNFQAITIPDNLYWLIFSICTMDKGINNRLS